MDEDLWYINAPDGTVNHIYCELTPSPVQSFIYFAARVIMSWYQLITIETYIVLYKGNCNEDIHAEDVCGFSFFLYSH